MLNVKFVLLNNVKWGPLWGFYTLCFLQTSLRSPSQILDLFFFCCTRAVLWRRQTPHKRPEASCSFSPLGGTSNVRSLQVLYPLRPEWKWGGKKTINKWNDFPKLNHWLLNTADRKHLIFPNDSEGHPHFGSFTGTAATLLPNTSCTLGCRSDRSGSEWYFGVKTMIPPPPPHSPFSIKGIFSVLPMAVKR